MYQGVLHMSRESLVGPFNDLIFKKMREMGVESLEEFARRIGMSRGTLYYLVRGRQTKAGTWVKPSIDTIVALARALDVPTHELLYRLEPDAPGSELRPETHVPLLGYVGGGPSQLEEIADRTVPVRWRGSARHLVAFRVRGDSMCAGKRPICDGDIIIVNTEDKGHPGAVVVARLANGEYVVKKMVNGHLVSTNPEANGGPPVIPLAEVEEVVGRVVEVRSMLD
ncbi:helix-turn-helix domain-containing protein [Thermus tengchongensis]|uniref:Helix-turn-helix domain-containing protein n=2 Tax=Thermus tengchongensis TaxID=1214928 RepID=A0A4Y9FAQ3_9DEIN|nr:helix-turn-helix domain-containing protein [Thermus tengchongensis]